MSFRCQRCTRAFPNKENPSTFRPERVVTRVRLRPPGDGPGSRIVKEENLCPHCVVGVEVVVVPLPVVKKQELGKPAPAEVW